MSKTVKTFVLCRNTSGSCEIFPFVATVSEDEYHLGEHYDMACNAAREQGFESPMEAFDEYEPAGKRLSGLFVDGDEAKPARVLVWVGEGGVEDVIADFPISYAVVCTDTEYSEMDCIFNVHVGKATHAAVGHTGTGSVIEGQADSVWRQVTAFQATETHWSPDETVAGGSV